MIIDMSPEVVEAILVCSAMCFIAVLVYKFLVRVEDNDQK